MNELEYDSTVERFIDYIMDGEDAKRGKAD